MDDTQNQHLKHKTIRVFFGFQVFGNCMRANSIIYCWKLHLDNLTFKLQNRMKNFILLIFRVSSWNFATMTINILQIQNLADRMRHSYKLTVQLVNWWVVKAMNWYAESHGATQFFWIFYRRSPTMIQLTKTHANMHINKR